MRRWSHAHALACWLVASAGCSTHIAQTTGKPQASSASDGGAAAACGALATRIRITTFDARSMVIANDEFHPVVIAPRRLGSLVAWRASADNAIRVAALDLNDRPTGSPFLQFSGAEVHSLIAPDDSGGVLAVVADDPDIYNSQYCISAATPNNAAHCQKMELVRFDGSGQVAWRSTLTKSAPIETDGALFIWSGYEHTARILWNGTYYGVYFRSAQSTARAGSTSEVDVRPGDTLRFVDQDGSMLARAGWDFGCVNSWSVRLAYDGHFFAACHGNPTPKSLHVAVLDPVPNPMPKTLNMLDGTDPYRRALGGLVPLSSGVWLDYISNESGNLRLRLARLTDSANVSQDQLIPGVRRIDGNYPFRPYMAAYGAGQLLLGYKAGNALQLAIADAATGAVLEGPVTTSAPIDQFQDFVSVPNGDVIWAFSSGNSSQIQVVRVLACR